MAPKKRSNVNKAYPANWRMRKRGNTYTIFFRVPKSARHLWDDKAECTLGKGSTLHQAEQAAYNAWTKRIAITDTPHTIGKALERYRVEVVPNKAPATQRNNFYSLKRLCAVIPADMPITAFETHHAFQYRDRCAAAESPKKANLDVEVLSHLFTKCFEWGTPGLREHPIKGKMKKIPLPPRDRYIEDWELDAFLSVASDLVKAYVPLKYALGIDQCMVLAIKLSDIQGDRLCIPKRTKIKKNIKAKKKDYMFFDTDGSSTGLKELIDDVLAWRRDHLKVLSGYLFCTSLGEPYLKEDGTASGFHSSWARSMKRALENTDLKTNFTEHDICAKTASDVDTLEEAAKLRGHLNKSTTDTTYRRKPEKVIPFRK